MAQQRGSNRKRIPVAGLRVGMYVSGLDRDWWETPYWRHAFLLQDERRLRELQTLCEYVDIDPSRGLDVADEEKETEGGGRITAPRRERRGGPRSDQGRQVPLEEELGRAQRLYDESHSVIAGLLEDVRLGRSLDSEPARARVRGMAESVVRNPNALLCLTRLKDRDRYTSMHSVDVCVFALAFGRHIGLDRQGLYELGLGALLHDLGKMRVPLEILNKPGPLTGSEFERMRRHPVYSRELLAGMEDIPERAVAAAYSHHERHDGSGYPEGLTGRDIPLFPRIIALCDVYDALTSRRSYNSPVSELAALRTLYEGRGTAFHPRTVDKFIQCVGVYPVGSLVVLSTGEMAVVTSVNQADRTRPVVKLLFDSKQRPYRTSRYLDLLTERYDPSGRPLAVQKVLDPAGQGTGPQEAVTGPARPSPRAAKGGRAPETGGSGPHAGHTETRRPRPWPLFPGAGRRQPR